MGEDRKVEFSIPAIDWSFLTPYAVLAFFGVILLVLDAFAPKTRPYLWLVAEVGVVSFFFLFCRFVFGRWNEVSLSGYEKTRTLLDTKDLSMMVQVDILYLVFTAIFTAATFIVILLSASYLKKGGFERGEYFALILFAFLGMLMVSHGKNLLYIFIGVETLTISLYVLTGFTRERIQSLESCLKYFIIGAFSTGFILYGMAMLYGVLGHLDLVRLERQIVAGGQGLATNPILLSALGLMLVGIGFKIAMFPFHSWAPDVYQGAPTPVTAYLAVGSKAAGFVLLFKIVIATMDGVKPHWVWLLWVLSVLTMSFGNLIALVQSDIKRILAYSGIAHAGTIMIALVASRTEGFTSMAFYFVAYLFMTTGAFGVVALLERKDGSGTTLDDFAGLGWRRPGLAALMMIFLISLAGVPPTAGFLAKLFVFKTALHEGFIWLAVLGLLNAVVSAYYYLKIIVYMYMKEPVKELEPFEESYGQRLPAYAALLISVIGVFWFGIFYGVEFAGKSLPKLMALVEKAGIV